MWACYLWALTDVRSSAAVFVLLALDLWLVLVSRTHRLGPTLSTQSQGRDSGLDKACPGERSLDVWEP